MKTIYAAFEKTVGCNLPVAVPDHWTKGDIRQALHRAMIHEPCLKEVLEDLDWELEADPRAAYAMVGFIEQFDWPEEPPVYKFPRRSARAHPSGSVDPVATA